jgi:hypothetical protein
MYMRVNDISSAQLLPQASESVAHTAGLLSVRNLREGVRGHNADSSGVARQQ